jgi:non-specific serine/threonine protein kinase
VSELCRRLDGLPLAIEIAAGHARLLRPRAILERLDQVTTQKAGAGYPDRQQTLRATIEWSVALLAKPQQTAFARAGVFRSTFGLDAFETVCSPGGTHDALGLLAPLVEGSLLREQEEATHGEPRFSMLETIRAYAAEQLEASGEAEDARDRHASFYLELVAQLGVELRKSGHDVALMRLQADENNIRAALEWSLGRGDHERVTEAALALTPFWTFRERTGEGRRLVRQLIDATGIPRHALARALAVESVLAYWEGDFASALAPATEANAIFRELGDKEGIALTLFPLGMMASMAGDVGHSRVLLEESHAIFDRAGDNWGTSLAKLALAWALNIAGADAPRGLYEEAIERAQTLGYEPETLAIGALGRRRALEGNVGEAKRLLGEALRRVVALDAKLGVSVYVDLLSDLAANTREDGLATRLAGAAEASFAALGVPISPVVGDRDARLRGLRGRLGEAFEAEYEEGKSLTLDAAVEQALAWAERG